MAFYLLPPDIAKSRFNGHAGFQDSVPGVSGSGISRYSRATGYRGYDTPTKVGARYFAPQPEYDERTDQPIPMAIGSKYDMGGVEAYRVRVHAAAKKNRKKLGFSRSDIDDLEPKKVA